MTQTANNKNSDAGSTPNAIVVQNLSKRFGVVQALDDISLDVPRGTIHGVVGQNGAGKSTLMQILSGVYHADSGEIILNGSPVTIHDPDHARKLGIRIIYQELNLTPHQTIAENIFLGMEPRNRLGLVGQREMRRRSREVLGRLGSSLSVDMKVERLNIGQQQLVEIAKALNSESRVLILDEPTAALEMQDIERLFDILTRFRDHGGTALYVSHRLGELFRICDAVTIMRDGKVVATNDIAETNRALVVTRMLGRPLAEVFPPLAAPGPTATALEARNVWSGLLRDVSLEASEGKILGIVGLEGSGMRELGRVLAGDQPLERGELIVNGKVRRFSHPAGAVRSGVVYLSADRKRDGLFPILSVLHNISVASLRDRQRAGVIRRNQEKDFVRDSVRKLAIASPNATQEVRFLSGGNQQKVLLARWLGASPRVFVLDEPTRGIDVGSKAEIYGIMRDLADHGATVIMISTDLTEVLGMSDEIIVLHAGEVAARLTGGLSEKDVLPHVLGVAA